MLQPLGALVRAFLDLDARPDSESLLEDRRSLEREGESRVHDITAWDLGHAFDLDAVWCRPADVRRVRIEEVPAALVGVVRAGGSGGAATRRG